MFLKTLNCIGQLGLWQMSPSKARASERTPATNETIWFYSGHLQHERETPDMEWIYMNIDKVQRKEPELTT